jgi:S1-C subfamily serine protease
LAATDTESGTAATGIGFAIPSNTVSDIASQIIKYGHVIDSHRPYLGVEIADTMGSDGVYVSAVTAGGPAAKAGIKVGNAIVAINGSPTATTGDLSSVVASLKPGQTVKVKVAHQDGTTATVTLTLGTYPGSTSG